MSLVELSPQLLNHAVKSLLCTGCRHEIFQPNVLPSLLGTTHRKWTASQQSSYAMHGPDGKYCRERSNWANRRPDRTPLCAVLHEGQWLRRFKALEGAATSWLCAPDSVYILSTERHDKHLERHHNCAASEP